MRTSRTRDRRVEIRRPEFASTSLGSLEDNPAVLPSNHGWIEGTEPIRIDEGTALALFQQLNASLRDPDAIDPAYSLYLEVRRYLGRLYS